MKLIRTSAFKLFLAVLVIGIGLVAGWLAARPWLVRSHLASAEQATMRRDYSTALAELRAALRIAPKDPAVFLGFCRIYRRLGQLERSQFFLSQAEKWGAYPRRIQQESWLLAAQSGNLREAEPHLGQLLLEAPELAADICEAFVIGYFANLRSAEAQRLLDAWEKDFPQDFQPPFMRGYLLHAMALYPEAVAAYERALALAPENIAIRCRMAESLRELRRYEDAERVLREAPESAREHPELLSVLGDLLFVVGRIEEAEDVVARAAEKSPRSFTVRRLFGQILLAMGKHSEAKEQLEIALQIRPNDPLARNALAQVLVALGEKEAAKLHFDYVAEAAPALRRFDQLMRVAIEEPDNVACRFEAGSILMKYGDPADALRWLQSVLQLDPKHAGSHRLLADYYLARGNWRLAQMHLAQLPAQTGSESQPQEAASQNIPAPPSQEHSTE